MNNGVIQQLCYRFRYGCQPVASMAISRFRFDHRFRWPELHGTIVVTESLKGLPPNRAADFSDPTFANQFGMRKFSCLVTSLGFSPILAHRRQQAGLACNPARIISDCSTIAGTRSARPAVRRLRDKATCPAARGLPHDRAILSISLQNRCLRHCPHAYLPSCQEHYRNRSPPGSPPGAGPRARTRWRCSTPPAPGKASC